MYEFIYGGLLFDRTKIHQTSKNYKSCIKKNDAAFDKYAVSNS